MSVSQKSKLQAFAALIPVSQYLSHLDFLNALFRAAKAANESYSYLQLAEDLGFSRTNVIRLVIVGQRPLTSKAAERIASSLALHGAERRYWLTLIKYANARLPAERDQLFQQLMNYKTKAQPAELDARQAEYFGEWYHPVIREMTALPEFQFDPEWIKAQLTFPLRLEQIKRSLALLVELGMLRFDPEKARYVRTDARVATSAEVDSLAIVRYHQKMIEIGRESITQISEARRDIRAITLTLPKSALPLLKGKIEAWINEIAALEDSETKEAALEDRGVVQVNVQMFPFTKP